MKKRAFGTVDIISLGLSLAIILLSMRTFTKVMAPESKNPDGSIQFEQLSNENDIVRKPENDFHLELHPIPTTAPDSASLHESEDDGQTWQTAISVKEVEMLAQTIYNEAQVLYWNGDAFGMTYSARQAAVAWCALNRLDSGCFGETLSEVLSAPHQFAYSETAPITDHMMWLAEDVISRWWNEKQGETNSGRTLPKKYLYFCGWDNENHFRKEYEDKELWDWSLPDPYKEVHQ